MVLVEVYEEVIEDVVGLVDQFTLRMLNFFKIRRSSQRTLISRNILSVFSGIENEYIAY